MRQFFQWQYFCFYKAKIASVHIYYFTCYIRQFHLAVPFLLLVITYFYLKHLRYRIYSGLPNFHINLKQIYESLDIFLISKNVSDVLMEYVFEKVFTLLIFSFNRLFRDTNIVIIEEINPHPYFGKTGIIYLCDFQTINTIYPFYNFPLNFYHIKSFLIIWQWKSYCACIFLYLFYPSIFYSSYLFFMVFL